jgi:hypothetical protein
MRTTVRLDDDLLARAKAYAALRNQSLTSVLEDALRALLQRHVDQADRSEVKIDVFFGDGLLPGVDLDSSARLHELLDEDQAERYRTDAMDAAA